MESHLKMVVSRSRKFFKTWVMVMENKWTHILDRISVIIQISTSYIQVWISEEFPHNKKNQKVDR